MEKLYLIMEECLKNQYGMKAVISLLETLEATYSEEEQAELKYMVYVIKTNLEALQEDMSAIIASMDNYIVLEAKN